MSYLKTLAAGTLLAGATIFGSCTSTNNKPQTNVSEAGYSTNIKNDTLYIRDTLKISDKPLKFEGFEAYLPNDTVWDSFSPESKFEYLGVSPESSSDTLKYARDGVAPDGTKVREIFQIFKKSATDTIPTIERIVKAIK